MYFISLSLFVDNIFAEIEYSFLFLVYIYSTNYKNVITDKNYYRVGGNYLKAVRVSLSQRKNLQTLMLY